MTTASTNSLTTASITRAAATELLDAARAARADLGSDMAIAVTDPHGHLKAFQSMDGTQLKLHERANAGIFDPAIQRLQREAEVVVPFIEHGRRLLIVATRPAGAH